MTEPIKLASGRFALYQTAKGGAHLALQVDGEEQPRHVEIPAMVVKMMMRKATFEESEMPPQLRVVDG
jgi:hypothetical protein